MWTKSFAGKWLLISLIPTGVLGFLIFVALSISTSGYTSGQPNSTATNLWVSFGFLFWSYWWVALVAGIVLKVWSNIEIGRLYREARQYAEMHNWLQISDTAWRSYKRNDTVFNVHQAYGKTSYILTVDVEGDSVSTDGFSRSLFALRFGDFLWNHVVEARAQVDASAVRQAREQWQRAEGIRALPGGYSVG